MRNGMATFVLAALIAGAASAREFHVSVGGSNDNDGSPDKPLRTIMAAAKLAQPGDVITVHEGTYRERITPPRGGESDAKRIVYQAAPGEHPVVKGSEMIRGWKPFVPGVWKVAVPNSLFGKYNPYKDLIAGDWFTDKGRPHHTGEVYLNGKSLWESHLLQRVLDPQMRKDVKDAKGSMWTWFCEVDEQNTYIYANFQDKDPNQELVEINVRDSCFYPDQTGRNYITIRGFRMCHAATQWAAPTAEQIGLIGTNWSKGWVIEDNEISDSKCSGITLGKDRKTGHNVWTKDPSKDGAIHYNEVIVRALEAGWSKETIGSHVVRRNVIHDCEQTGICGSLGAVFSQIYDNHIYNIWAKRQFTGAEMAGIKLHAAIDVLIRHNRIHDAGRGMWMDWMAQGTHITGNLCYDNTTDDLFVEVDHGPFLVDNNVFLSPLNLHTQSEGGAYAHNLFGGGLLSRSELKRSTPYHFAHSTRVAGLSDIKGGDDRFYNNIFVGTGSAPATAAAQPQQAKRPVRFTYGLATFDPRERQLFTGGNVYWTGAEPYRAEANPSVQMAFDPAIKLIDEGAHVRLELVISPSLSQGKTALVTTELLGKAAVPGLGYETPEGSSLTVDVDFLGNRRSESTPTAGPFENPGTGLVCLKLW